MQQIDWAKVSAEGDLPTQLFTQAQQRLKRADAAQAARDAVMARLSANAWAALRDAPEGDPPAQRLTAASAAFLREEVRRCADWPALFFGADLPDRLTREAGRRFGSSPDADSAYNYALEQISAGNWRKPREGYRGEGSAEGFLRIAFLNLLEEYRVKKYGKRRPPEWVRRLGWERVYRLFCLQRFDAEAVVDLLAARAEAKAAEIRQAIREIGGRVRDCRQGTGEVAVSGSDMEDSPDESLTGAPASHALEREEFQALLEVLRIRVTGRPPDGDAAAPPAALEEALGFEDHEVLLLRLVYHEGLTIPKAAKAMRPPLHEQKARRLHKALVARIRETLQAAGLDVSTV